MRYFEIKFLGFFSWNVCKLLVVNSQFPYLNINSKNASLISSSPKTIQKIMTLCINATYNEREEAPSSSSLDEEYLNGTLPFISIVALGKLFCGFNKVGNLHNLQLLTLFTCKLKKVEGNNK